MEGLITAELNGFVKYGTLNLLKPGVEEMGVETAFGPFTFNVNPIPVLITTVTLAAPADPPPTRVAGQLFTDLDGNGLYIGADQALPGATARLGCYTPFGFYYIGSVVTDDQGVFRLSADRNYRHRLDYRTINGITGVLDLPVVNQSVWLPIPVEPEAATQTSE
jgi:hypothetical protein